MKRPEECSSIDEIRKGIDQIDFEILQLLGQRFGFVKEIMRFKNTPEDVRAPERYQAVLAQRRRWATEVGLAPDVVEEMYRNLIAYFINEEMKGLESPHLESPHPESPHPESPQGKA